VSMQIEKAITRDFQRWLRLLFDIGKRDSINKQLSRRRLSYLCFIW
jgi:hypothetical protein